MTRTLHPRLARSLIGALVTAPFGLQAPAGEPTSPPSLPSFYRHISLISCHLKSGRGTCMTTDLWNARHFGAHDKPPCANCGNRTFLARRSPASDHALHLERQTFACLECNLDFERVVGADGKAVRSTALASN